jgi:hypothetical protein
LPLFVVEAVEETDEDFWEEGYYLVSAPSGREAKAQISAKMLSEHPHDLCKRGKKHVGLGKVTAKPAKTFRVPESGVLAHWDRYTEWDRSQGRV